MKKATGAKSAAAQTKRRPASVAKPLRTTEWTFLTNHAHVLLCLSREPTALMRDVATDVGITERAVQRIVADLERAGYLLREKEGRRNQYEVCADLPLRHPIERHRTVASLLGLLERRKGPRS
jgi:DNA-binding transcriptional ArsR family regulator